MNNYFKFITVAISSFIMGVITTMYYVQSDLADAPLTPRQKELQAIAIEAEKRPFFPVVAPVGNALSDEQ